MKVIGLHFEHKRYGRGLVLCCTSVYEKNANSETTLKMTLFCRDALMNEPWYKSNTNLSFDCYLKTYIF